MSRIADLVPVNLLEVLQEAYQNYLQTSAAIYELDGSYAACLITSEYCNCLTDACEAKAGKGKGICHDDCWQISKKSIDLMKPLGEECSGGLFIYAVPIMLEGTPIGAANAAVSNPPKDIKTIKEIATKYGTSVKEVQSAIDEYEDRPEYVRESAKRQIEITARTIASLYKVFYELREKEKNLTGEITKRKRLEDKLKTLNESLERRVAERTEELQESKTQLQDIIDNSSAAIYVKDTDYRLTLVNRYVENVLHLSKDELIGKTDYDILPEELADVTRANDRTVFETGVPLETEERIQTNNKTRIYIAHKFPLLDSEGVPYAVCGIATDITEHKETEKELRRSEENLSQAQRIAHIGSWEWDIIDNKTFYSDEACRLFGLNPQEHSMTYEDFQKFVHPDDRKLVKESVTTALYDRKPYRLDFRIVRADGTELIVHSQAEVEFDKTGKPLRMTGTVQDITERKQTEEELQRNLGILRAVIEGTVDIVFVKDRQGRMLMINTAGTHLFGKPVEEIVGKDSTELFPPDTARQIADDDRRIMDSGKTETYEEAATVNDITRTYLTTKGPYLDHKGNVIGIIGIAHDITERKRTDEQIKASLKEKEVLLNEIHHRVKNNLQIISSLLEMSRMQTDNKEANRLLTDACSRVSTMALIHSQLYRSNRFDRIDMDRHLRETTGSLLQLYGQKKNIAIDIKASGVYLPVSQAIPTALALNELISNALEHAYKDREKGTLEISMQRAADDTVSIRVRDDGVGIPEGLDPYKSDSLGLKLVRNLVQRQLRGELRYNISKGTEFIIEFKVSEENAKEA